jgi:hypothetical protein
MKIKEIAEAMSEYGLVSQRLVCTFGCAMRRSGWRFGSGLLSRRAGPRVLPQTRIGRLPLGNEVVLDYASNFDRLAR